MPNESIVCPKCKAEMEAGFILEMVGRHKLADQWVEGAPESSFWSGIKNWNDRRKYHVTTYRCAGCGDLESYAFSAQQ